MREREILPSYPFGKKLKPTLSKKFFFSLFLQEKYIQTKHWVAFCMNNYNNFFIYRKIFSSHKHTLGLYFWRFSAMDPLCWKFLTPFFFLFHVFCKLHALLPEFKISVDIWSTFLSFGNQNILKKLNKLRFLNPSSQLKFCKLIQENKIHEFTNSRKLKPIKIQQKNWA